MKLKRGKWQLNCYRHNYLLWHIISSLSPYFPSLSYTQAQQGKEPLPNDVSTLSGGLDVRQRAITNALTGIILCWRTSSPRQRQGRFHKASCASPRTHSHAQVLFSFFRFSPMQTIETGGWIHRPSVVMLLHVRKEISHAVSPWMLHCERFSF